MARWSRRSLRLVLAVGLVASTRAVADSSIRCAGGIVQVGDSKLDLLAKCGKPALEEQIAQGPAIVEKRDGRATTTPSAGAERWTYDFGPRQFLQVVTLDLGRVVGVQRGGYGYPQDLPRDGGTARARCESAAIRVGDWKLDLLAKCGGPVSRELRVEPRPASNAEPGLTSVTVEVWTYDFGPQQFTSIVTLEDGRVVRVDRGSYGSAR